MTLPLAQRELAPKIVSRQMQTEAQLEIKRPVAYFLRQLALLRCAVDGAFIFALHFYLQ